MPGRPPKSRKLHVLQGTYRKDRHARIEAEPTVGYPVMPDWMTESQKSIWAEIKGAMESTNLITLAETQLLTSYVVLTDRIQNAARNGDDIPASNFTAQTSMGTRLGLDQIGRVKMAKPEAPKQADEWAAFA